MTKVSKIITSSINILLFFAATINLKLCSTSLDWLTTISLTAELSTWLTISSSAEMTSPLSVFDT